MASPPPWSIVEAEFEAAAQAPEQLPPPLGVEVAFAGRSNVGKSSLMNALMERRKLVRTSATPGCTRAINFFKARARDGAELRLVDLPGYGYAKRSKTERNQWARMIESYLAERDHLRAVVMLVDARHGLTDDDRTLADFVRARSEVRLVVVATKIDKVPKSKRRSHLAKLQAGAPVLGASAVSGEGIAELWKAIRRAAGVPLASEGPSADRPQH